MHLLKSTPDVLRQLLTAAAADAAVVERTALNPAPFRRQDIPFPPTCAYSRSEPNSASTALSIPSRTAAAASAETNWTSSSIPTVRHCSMEREAPMSILSAKQLCLLYKVIKWQPSVFTGRLPFLIFPFLPKLFTIIKYIPRYHS